MIPLLSLKQFLRDMRNQKLRTLMTMFGILWGTVAILILMGFGTGLQQSQIKRFKGLGDNISMIWPGMTSKPWKGLPRGRRIHFTEEDVAHIKSSNPNINISPEYRRWSVSLKSGKTNKLAYVAGVWPEFGDMRNVIPQAGGRFIDALDMLERKRVIFLGDELAQNLFGTEDIIGRSLLVNGAPFTVIGVMKEKDQNSSYSGRDNNQSWIPSTTFRTMWTRRYPDIMIVQPPEMKNMASVKKSIYAFLSAKYTFDPDDKESLQIWDTTESFKVFYDFFAAFKVFLIGIGLMTLIAGGIGVTNIMNVVLEERTKEIGIKMAVGAKKSNIMAQFLFETIILTAIGGALGFLIAHLTVWAFPARYTEYVGVPTINTSGAFLAIAALGLVALASGYFPARRAATLEPVKALKLF